MSDQKTTVNTKVLSGVVGVDVNPKTNQEYRWFETDLLFGQKYQIKTTKYGSHFLQCVFCGRDTSNQGASNGVLVGGGGAIIIHPEDYEKSLDGGSMGWFPVGSECVKSVPAEFRLTNIYDDKVKGV